MEYLERVAALVPRAAGPNAVMAAWLHGVARIGLRPSDLAAHGVPSGVIQIIKAVAIRDSPTVPARHVATLRSCPGARLVLSAIVADRHRPGVEVTQPQVRRDIQLLTAAGLPLPARLAPHQPPTDTATLLSQLDPEHPNRWEAVWTASLAGEAAALRPLFTAYLAAEAGDPRWAIGPGRGSAQKYLGGVVRGFARLGLAGDPQAAQVFLEMAVHPSEWMRAAGIRGLSAYPDHAGTIERALHDPSKMVISAAARALPAERVPALSDQLFAIARHSETDWLGARLAALSALSTAGDLEARTMLVELLPTGKRIVPDLAKSPATDDDQAFIRAVAGHLRGRRSARVAAARFLGDRRSGEAVPALIAALREELPGGPDIEALLACVKALGQIRDPAAIPAIGEACRHPRARVRDTALQALFWSEDPRVTEIALTAAEDFTQSVRHRAIGLLALRGDQRASARLLAACDGPLASVALRGLIRLADERAVPGLIDVLTSATDRRVLHLAGRALVASARKPVLPPWSMGRKLSLPQLRAAIWVMGEQCMAPNYSLHLYFSAHQDELVRTRAVTALGKAGGPKSGEHLAAALKDISPRVRAAAATATGAVASRAANDASFQGQARTWLEPLRSDPHPAVRMATGAALQRLTEWPD